MSAPYLILGFFVLPLWIGAGLADYLCHRAARIQESSGTPESLLHLVQFGLVGLPLTAGLFLRPNAGFFLFAALCVLLHHAVAYIDVRYANGTRKVEPVEQMVHSFLELLPITVLLILGIAEWPQFLALLGLGPQAAEFAPEFRPVPSAYTMALLAAAFVFNFLPYLEELVRCMKSARKEA